MVLDLDSSSGNTPSLLPVCLSSVELSLFPARGTALADRSKPLGRHPGCAAHELLAGPAVDLQEVVVMVIVFVLNRGLLLFSLGFFSDQIFQSLDESDHLVLFLHQFIVDVLRRKVWVFEAVLRAP